MKRSPILLCLLAAVALTGVTCRRPMEKKDDDAHILTPDKGALKERIDNALGFAHRRATLMATHHGFWTIFHAILGLGFDLTITDDKGKQVNALEHICSGKPMPGLEFRVVPVEVDGKLVQLVDVISSGQGAKGGMFFSQGHQDQFIAEMAQWGMRPDKEMTVDGKKYTFKDFCEYSRLRASTSRPKDEQEGDPKQELSWAIIIVAQYYGTAHEWTNKKQEKLKFEDVVRYELDEPINDAACGGTHRLFGLTWAYHLHLAKGGKKEGVWLDVEAKIKKYKDIARDTQNKDGSLSAEFFKSKAHSKELDSRIRTTGHTLEWLALALDDDELELPWVRNAAEALATMILEVKEDAFNGGNMFHATHGLHIYRARAWNLLATPGAPLVPLPPKAKKA